MSRRPSTEQMRKSLKLATKAAICAAGTAADLVANKLVRVGETALSFCQSSHEDHVNRFVGLDVALDLDFCAGEPIHARALASAQGYGLHRLTADRAAGSLGHADIRLFSRECAELLDATFAALDDGVVCERDRLLMLAQLGDVERVVAGFRAKLEVGA